MSFTFVPFGSLYAEPVRNGLTRPTVVRGEGYRMVNMGEIFAYDRISDQEMERVQLNERELRVATLEVGDLLFARSSLKAEGTGKCSIVLSLPEATTFESHLIRARLDQGKVDPRFYFYFFQSYYGRATVLSIAKQVGAAGLPGSKLGDLSVPYPPRPVQERIADILTAYDDMIENNRRRMALLEEASRQFYREWFVRLRFPGHEHTRIANGVPEGWEKTTAISEMEVLSGGTPRTSVSDYWDGDIPFYTPKDSTDSPYVLQTERSITELGLKNCNSRLYAPDTVFISARGTVGKLNLAARSMAMSQSCYALRGKGHLSQLFLFCAVKEAIEHFKQHAVGAVFDAIVVDTFKLIPFVVPDEKKVGHFEEAVAPMFRQVANLMEQNEKLRAACDLLLPRLMSGEIAA